MKILAVDPGRTTGICLLDSDGDRIKVETAYEILWEDRFPGLKALVACTLVNHINRPLSTLAVVIESFRLRQGRAQELAGSDFPSLQIIGILQAFMYVVSPELVAQIVFQEPSCMTRVSILEADRSWVEGSPHKMDAYKHARYYSLMRRPL